jgi:hypothetical protein
VGEADLPFTLSVCVLKVAQYAIIIRVSGGKHQSLVACKLRTALQCRKMKSVMTWHFLILFCARIKFVYVNIQAKSNQNKELGY